MLLDIIHTQEQSYSVLHTIHMYQGEIQRITSNDGGVTINTLIFTKDNSVKLQEYITVGIDRIYLLNLTEEL